MSKEVYKVTLGDVGVRLRNKVNVCEAFLDDIFSNSGLDDRELLLILDDKNGFGYEEEKRRAFAAPSYLYSPTGFRNTKTYREEMERIDLQQWTEWDTVVYIPKITTDKWKDFKPYFAFVLGHELEHVKVIRENVKFHMCATRLCYWNGDIFVKAGIDCKSMKNWNFPLEFHCNKKGKNLATDLFGKEELCNCFNSLRASKIETCKHKPYLTFVRDELKGEPYTKNIWQSVCRDIRVYYYNKKLKKAAHEIWKDQKSNGDEIAEQFDINEFLPLD